MRPASWSALDTAHCGQHARSGYALFPAGHAAFPAHCGYTRQLIKEQHAVVAQSDLPGVRVDCHRPTGPPHSRFGLARLTAAAASDPGPAPRR